ncbi:hypothetical protein B0H15DRAFT_799497 [Mycena belliarum]|uniref:Uncharacterized protein n=1 Tax=Mycena belliarum TaxID=1033014 RepID=A0AAD6XW93_9AGAR|nr:hypothetical protein B0H15DRAFT_799497 [Mycena belliae]
MGSPWTPVHLVSANFGKSRQSIGHPTIDVAGEFLASSPHNQCSRPSIMPPPVNKNNNCCPICQTHLSPKRRKSDGRWFLKCYSPSAHANEGGRTYFFHFPPTPAQSESPPPTSRLLAPSTSSSSSPQRPRPASTAPKHCVYTRCKSTRINIKCRQQMCQKHCISSGGCTRHAISPKFTVSSAPLSNPQFYEDLHQAALAPLRALDAFRAQVHPKEWELDSLFGVKPLSPAERAREQQEDADIAEALRRSRETREEETDITEAVQRSRNRIERQRKRREDFQQLADEVARPSPPPIPASLPPRSLFTTPDPPSLLSLLRDHKPMSISQRATQRFPLIEWFDSITPAVVTMVQDCPQWPHWSLGFQGASYQCYSTQYSTWMTLKPDYVHSVSTDRPIFIRPLGVTGIDEDELIQRFKSSSSPRAWNVPTTCARRRKTPVFEVIDDSDDEVEVVAHKRRRLFLPSPSSA